MGTPSYMAPEQADGSKDIGPLADVYALGAILYECLTGRPPFKADTAFNTILQVLTEEPVPPSQIQSQVPRDLETVCLKCLSKVPARRYTSAAELAADLDRFLAGEPIQARPVSAWERAAKWARRRPAVAGLLLAVVVVTLAGFCLASWKWRKAVAAKDIADDGRRDAERSEAQEREARQEADLQTKKAVRMAAKLSLDRGLSFCEQGEIARGMLWFTQALRLAPKGDEELRRAIRVNLAGWYPALQRPPGLGSGGRIRASG
jgi:hypothetical protein